MYYLQSRLTDQLLLKKARNADIIRVMKRSVFLAIFALFFCGTISTFAQGRPLAKGVSAKALENKAVELSWEFPAKTQPKITGVQIYRSLRPYSSTQDLQGDLPIAELDAGAKTYSDALDANGSYFYAVLAVTQKGAYKIIIPGVNATTSGVRPKIAAEPQEEQAPEQEDYVSSIDPESLSESQKELLYADKKMRKAPLPYPGTLLGFDNGKTKMSGAAQKSAAELGSKKKRAAVAIKTPHFFEEDMYSPDGGDEYTLFETLRAGLAPKKYAQSVELLQDFLRVHRNKETTERAQFYLGESHYFCKDYKSAIRCFLEVQDAFPELSKQWIDSSLDLLEIN